MDIKQIQEAMKEMKALNVKGNDYTMVAQRIEAFRKHVGAAYSINSEILQNDSKTILIKASILDKDGRVVATGLAEELRGTGTVNKTSAMENCETSAWGRALACLGLHGGKMASIEEITIAENKDKQIDAEAEHDAAVRAEANALPLLNDNTNSADKWQELCAELKQKIQHCSATWQIKDLAQKRSNDIAALNENRPDLGADLKAYSEVRWEQING